MYLQTSDSVLVKFNHSIWDLYMKLIKYIAAIAVVASTSLVSGGNATATNHTQAVAGVCPNWPYCRDVEIADQTMDTNQYMKLEAVRKAV
ncbi:hypothetical protein GCM10009426_04650 [Rheinheimera tangshanensis]|jgi:hypothetical protein|nr:hypothetical protein GCM10010920_04490 [Rheinheimera tangshanensis]